MPKCSSRCLKSFSWVQRLNIRKIICGAGRWRSSVRMPTWTVRSWGLVARTKSWRILGFFGPVLLVVARAFQRVLARRLLWVPGAGLEILFPGDEVIVGCRHRLGEDLLAENAPVHDA